MKIRRNHLGYRVGEDHQKADLTTEEVKAMRAKYQPGKRGCGYASLAHEFGCGVSTARDICTYRTRVWE